MDPMIWVWLGLTVVLLIFEICTTSLTTIWFAAGSLTSFVLALFKLPLWVQIVAFVVVSVVLLIFTRPLVERVLKVGKVKTNIDELIGNILLITAGLSAGKNDHDRFSRVFRTGIGRNKDF